MVPPHLQEAIAGGDTISELTLRPGLTGMRKSGTCTSRIG
jgi:hypothetical protein